MSSSTRLAMLSACSLAGVGLAAAIACYLPTQLPATPDATAVVDLAESEPRDADDEQNSSLDAEPFSASNDESNGGVLAEPALSSRRAWVDARPPAPADERGSSGRWSNQVPPARAGQWVTATTLPAFAAQVPAHDPAPVETPILSGASSPSTDESNSIDLAPFLSSGQAPSPARPLAPPGAGPDDVERPVAGRAAGVTGTVVSEGPAAKGGSRSSKNRIVRGEGDGRLSVHLQDADLREVLDLLGEQGGLNILASNTVQGRVSASLNNVDIDTALTAILRSSGYLLRREGDFLFVGSATDFQTMQHSLDRIGTRVYRPNYIRAAELKELIVPLMTQGVGTVSVTSPSQMGISAESSNAGGDQYAGGEAVLVRDYEAVLAQIDQTFEELDRRPMQVAIEAMILSVKLKDSFDMGVDFLMLRDKNHARMATGSPLTDLGGLDFDKGGLKFAFLDSSLGAFLSALEVVGDTNVIATPRLMVVNKHKAEILIGAQLGYVNSTTSNLTSTTQSVSFLEVGTQLRLRPFISDDGMIRMEVHPESSTGQVRIQEGFTLPDKEVTQVTTNIMVRDGRTVLIGGLLREDLTKDVNQVPVLGSLPGVGFLFRNKKETTERRELIILITPHIVCDEPAEMEGDREAGEFHRRHATYADHMSPLSTRFIGRKYFRLAQESWGGGDRARALRYVNLAIHFEPAYRAAIDLRSDIVAGSHEGDHSRGGFATVDDSGEHPLDGEQIAPWLLDELEGQPVASGPPAYPPDPGRTGRTRNIVRPGSLR